MKKYYAILVALFPLIGFAQIKQIPFAELTTGSGMYFGAEMTTTTITVTVQGPSDRFLAFGFGTGMASGNDAIIWSTLGTGAGPLQLRDHRMAGTGVEPTVDAQQDWTVTSNNVSGGNRTIIATRALNTGDANDVTFSFAATSQNLFWAKGPSATNQLQYHGASNRASGIIRNWITPDVTPPTVNSTSPADNAIGASITTNLSIVFSEAISWGTGNLTLYDGSNTVIQTVNSASPGVSIVGSNFTYNPPGNLVINTDYYVQIDATAFKDAANNFFAGISDNTTWNFNTNDVTAPVLNTSSLIPLDNATGVAITTPFSLSFNENIQAGSGDIHLFTGAGTPVESYDVTSSPLITISGSTLSINPTDLTVNTAYYIQIDAGAIEDLSGNDYAGIANTTSWNFNTNDVTPPTAVTPFNPADNDVNVPVSNALSISFNEPIQLGSSGALEIFNGAGTLFESFSVSSLGVIVAGSTMSISPGTSFEENTEYYVHISAGYIEDVMGNDYAGISDNTTWNFTTGDFTAPTSIALSPLDDQLDIPTTGNTFSMTLSEDIVLGSGSIFLINETSGSSEEFSDALSNITVSGDQLSFSPAANLEEGTGYHVLIDAGAFEDLAGNDFQGIADTTWWNFVTADGVGIQELSSTEFSWNGKVLTILHPFEAGEIRDLNGKLILEFTSAQNDLSQLPTGIYLAIIHTKQQLAHLRIYVD